MLKRNIVVFVEALHLPSRGEPPLLGSCAMLPLVSMAVAKEFDHHFEQSDDDTQASASSSSAILPHATTTANGTTTTT